MIYNLYFVFIGNNILHLKKVRQQEFFEVTFLGFIWDLDFGDAQCIFKKFRFGNPMNI
jgi:hypothetical protein